MINEKTMGDLKFTMHGNTATHLPQGLGSRSTSADLGL